MDRRYRLFSWEHSYFSGKVRSYLRYKKRLGDLDYEDILASADLIQGLLLPATGTGAVPQLQTPDGSFVQDSSEIIDFCERQHPEPAVIPEPSTRPRQCLAGYLIELLADEWMVVYAFFERWHHSLPFIEPNHARFNAQQWGPVFAPDSGGSARRELAQTMFSGPMGATDPESPRGIFAGVRALGVTPRTETAWTASSERVLDLLERHFDEHDFVLGGRPSLADFSLMGPLYAHLFRDAVPGFAMRTRHPLVAEWVERTNGTNALNARTYDQKLYSLGEGGSLVPRPAARHAGQWLPDDTVPETLRAILQVFFSEMWPMLTSTLSSLRSYLASDSHTAGAELPGKTFTSTPGFEALQTGEGALTHEFEIGGVRERRMVLPYQVWMLQRLADALRACRATAAGRDGLEELLGALDGGKALLDLDALLAGCRVRKEGGRIFSA
ncbi:MAG: glutathione S-transferase family protein, partial [Myxococcota bacterium]